MGYGPNYHEPFKPSTDDPTNLTPSEAEHWRQNQWVRDYRNFNEIPSSNLTDSALVAWICEGGKLKDIRKEYWSEELLHAAVRRDPDAFKLIGVGDSADHRMLSFVCCKAGCLQFSDLLPEYQDEEFVLELVKPYAYMLEGIDFAGKFSHLLTDRVIDAICRKSVAHAYEFACGWCRMAKSRIQDDSIRAAIAVGINDYFRLAEMGKEHVLVGMLKEGFWPDQRHFLRNSPSQYPPSSPADVLQRINDNFGSNMRALYISWLKTRSIEELINCLQGSQEGLDLIFEVIPPEHLKDQLKAHRPLRGRYLEHELGM